MARRHDELAHGDALCRIQIQVLAVLNKPPARNQLSIDLDTRTRFGGQVVLPTHSNHPAVKDISRHVVDARPPVDGRHAFHSRRFRFVDESIAVPAGTVSTSTLGASTNTLSWLTRGTPTKRAVAAIHRSASFDFSASP